VYKTEVGNEGDDWARCSAKLSRTLSRQMVTMCCQSRVVVKLSLKARNFLRGKEFLMGEDKQEVPTATIVGTGSSK